MSDVFHIITYPSLSLLSFLATNRPLLHSLFISGHIDVSEDKCRQSIFISVCPSVRRSALAESDMSGIAWSILEKSIRFGPAVRLSVPSGHCVITWALMTSRGQTAGAQPPPIRVDLSACRRRSSALIINLFKSFLSQNCTLIFRPLISFTAKNSVLVQPGFFTDITSAGFLLLFVRIKKNLHRFVAKLFRRGSTLH